MIPSKVMKVSLLMLPFTLLAIFLIYPVVIVLGQGLLFGPGSSFIEVIGSQVSQRVFVFTFSQALLSTLVALVLGIPGALIIAKLRFKGKSIIRVLLTIPFILPPIVVVVGFLQVFGSGGILDSLAMWLLGSSNTVINIASGYSGIVLAHAFYNVPLFLLMISATLERLDPEIEEMAEILGSSSVHKFRHITLPHIRSSIVAASVLTFLFCFMSFPIVLALGEGSFITLEIQIWNAFRFFDYGEAASLALVQLFITLSLAYVYVKSGGEHQDAVGKTSYLKTFSFSEISRRYRVVIIAYAVILFILVVGPMLAVIRSAIYDPLTRQYTLRGFENLLDAKIDGAFMPLINSLFYAGLATLFSVILGLLLANAQRARTKMLPEMTSMMTLLPLGISAITIAYGLMIAIAVPLGISSNAWSLIVIAQTLIGVPFSTRAIEIARSKIDSVILEQAEILGAKSLHRLFFVELPLLAPGILVAAVFSFAMSIGEMSATIFLASSENITLAISIYRDLAVKKFVEAGAASLVLVMICIGAFLIMEKVAENGYRGTL